MAGAGAGAGAGDEIMSKGGAGAAVGAENKRLRNTANAGQGYIVLWLILPGKTRKFSLQQQIQIPRYNLVYTLARSQTRIVHNSEENINF